MTTTFEQHLYALKVKSVSGQWDSGSWRKESALGKPDDLSWNPQDVWGQNEFIELVYEKALHITKIIVYIKHSKGALAKVSVANSHSVNPNNYTTVLQQAPISDYSAGQIEVTVPSDVTAYGDTVRIDANQSLCHSFYLNAVEIIGKSQGPQKITLKTYPTLTSQGISLSFTKEEPDVLGGLHAGTAPPAFKMVTVDEGKWILYAEPYYNPPNAASALVFGKGTHGLPATFVTKSLRPISAEQDAITLFAKDNFGGEMCSTIANKESLSELPAYSANGVSSIIVNPTIHVWEVFQNANFGTPSVTLGTGHYANANEIGGGGWPDNSIQSVRKM